MDQLRIANWQRTEDGSKGKNRPEPLQRPGIEQAKKEKSSRINASAEAWKARQEARRKRQAESQKPAVA